MIIELKKLVLAALAFLLPASLLLSCGGDKNEKPEPDDTPTSGQINISVDESFSLLFDTQIYTFESLYPKAKIKASYKPEGEVINDIFNDSFRVIVMARPFSEDEVKALDAKRIHPTTVKIAEDAVALIVNKDNPDSLLMMDQLRNILAGKDTLWSQIDPKAPAQKIAVVFDNNNSANARYLQQTLMNGAGFNDNCFAVKSNEQVIDYVNANKNALGVISVNWISDSDDTLTNRFLGKVKVVSVCKTEGLDYYKPYQAYIKTKDYPLCREVFLMYRGRNMSLGTGFASFVAGDKGQRIVLKSGLVPAISPVRIIEINNK
jgi:phosphate transport system substrate-binding protein